MEGISSPDRARSPLGLEGPAAAVGAAGARVGRGRRRELASRAPARSGSSKVRLLAAGMALACGACATRGQTGEPTPLDRRWYAERGVELPAPFGVSVMSLGMQRDLEVTDVKVTIPGQPPQSISDRVDFAIENQTMLSMVRIDHWVLPFLNVYVLGGETRTETSLRSRFEIQPPIGGPIPVEVEQNSKVSGLNYGGGATIVLGYGDWFLMTDANYARSDLDVFEETIDAWFLSSRVGWQYTNPRTQVRLWGGAGYLASSRELRIVVDVPVVGQTVVDVDQRPVDPWTYQVGANLGIDRTWDVMVELGTNFNDATMAIVSVGYRF